MKKLLLSLLLLFISFGVFAQENWEDKKKMDQLKKEYIRALGQYMKVYEDISKRQDKWNDIIEKKKQDNTWDYKNEKQVREASEIENKLVWSPFEDPNKEEKQKLIYKQNFKPDTRAIRNILESINKQEKLSREAREDLNKVDDTFYSLVLQGYNATRNVLLILKEMEWSNS